MLRADAEGVVLEWRAPALSSSRVTGEDGHIYSVLGAPGWSQTHTPGQPQLPFASTLAVVPPSGDVTIHVQTVEQTRRPLRDPVVPARAPVVVGTYPGKVEWEWTLDQRAYTGEEQPTTDVVTLEEAGWLRGHRLVRVTFYPVRLSHDRNALEVTDLVRVELRFEEQPLDDAQIDGRWGRDDPFTPTLQKSVVNPAQVIQFARPEPLASGAGAALGTAQAAAGSSAGADYLIIAHSKFMSAIAPLATHRASNDGLRVVSTTVETIYDDYPGYDEHEAIEAYIYDAYHNWTPPALQYVLLVGDGVLGSTSLSQQYVTSQTFVPPYPLTLSPPWGGGSWEAASDNRFVTVDGSDNIADVLIGRLPVNTVAQATTVVQKILAYETDPPQWPWNQRVLFFAGNESDAPYHRYSDEVYDEHVPAASNWRRVYFCTSNCDEPHLYDEISVANERTEHELAIGGLLASYVGHSSWHQWAVDPATYAPMFHLDDVASLDNGGALPVFLQMTCYTGDFSHPEWDTLDETLLRRSGGGAVATWGPTTLGLSLGHNVLHKGFFDAVFEKDITKLGKVIEAAQLDLIAWDSSAYYLDLLDTFVLLGDPAMDLNLTVVPWSHATFLPVTLRAR